MPPDAPPPRRYRAFISYSHADAAAADGLHRGLERYRVPRALVGRETARGPVPGRLIPIFRDREELSASTDLTAEIRAALENSQALIVLCSPRAARSRWVNEEILSFKRLGRADRIFAYIIDGEPGSGEPATECFPPALKFHLGPDGVLSDSPAEPIAADARETGDGPDNARLKLIAGLLGVGLDALKQREAQARRRRTAIAYALAGIFAVLALASTWFAVVAERQRSRAEGNLQAGIEAANTMIFDIIDATRNLTGMQQSRLAEALRKTEALLDTLADGQALPAEGRRAMAAAQIALSNALLAAGDSEGSLAAAEKALATSRELHAAFPEDPEYGHDVIVALSRAAGALQQRGALAEAEARLMEALQLAEGRVAEMPDSLPRRAAVAGILENLGDIYEADSRENTALEMHRRSLELRREIVAAEPGNDVYAQDFAVSLDRVGDIVMRRGAADEALALYEEGKAINERLAAATPADAKRQHNLAASHTKIGDVRLAEGDAATALQAYDLSLEILTRITSADPGNAAYLLSLSATQERRGDALAALGDMIAAAAAYEACLAQRQQIAAGDPANITILRATAATHDKIGDLKMISGDIRGAIEAFETARDIREQVRAAQPNRAADRELMVSLSKLGGAWLAAGDVQRATAFLAEGLALARALYEADPKDPLAERDLMTALAGRGDALQATGDLKGAGEALSEALEIARRRYAAARDDPDAARNLVGALARMGDIRTAEAAYREAYIHYLEALPIATALSRRYPDNLVYSGDLAACHGRIGQLWLIRESYGDALSHFVIALKAHEERAAKAPGNPAVQVDLMIAHVRVGETHERMGDREKAAAAYRAALALADALVAARPDSEPMKNDREVIRRALERAEG